MNKRGLKMLVLALQAKHVHSLDPKKSWLLKVLKFIATSSLERARLKHVLIQSTFTQKSQILKCIYGEDDRTPVTEALLTEYEKLVDLDSPKFKFARNARASFIMTTVSSLKKKNMSEYSLIPTASYGDSHGLCDDEKFYKDSVVGFCSGFCFKKKENYYFVTAGHCTTKRDSSDFAFIFNYRSDSGSEPPLQIDSKNIVFGRDLGKPFASEFTPDQQDYAVYKTSVAPPYYLEFEDLQNAYFKNEDLQTDEVKSHKDTTHADTSSANNTDIGNSTADSTDVEKKITQTPIYMIGHPSGLSQMSTIGKVLKTSSKIYVTTNLSAFHGNSGSLVAESKSGKVLGILVRGDKDYEVSEDMTCNITRVCPLSGEGCKGEDVVLMSLILSRLFSNS